MFYLNDFRDVDQAFLEAGGLTTIYGIIWIRYKIQDYIQVHGKIPTSKNLKFLHSHLRSTDYTKYGFSSWERLITQNIGKSLVNRRWKGTVGLLEAKRRIRQFYNLQGKPPSAFEFPDFDKYCKSGSWKQQGITTWGDLLSYALKKKLKTYYRKTWSGAFGLNRARMMLYKYIATNKLIPVKEKFHGGVQESLKESRWTIYGIDSWTDLLLTIHVLTSEQISNNIAYRGAQKDFEKPKSEKCRFKDFEFSKVFLELPNLRRLIINHTNLSMPPESITSLSHLTELDLKNNRLLSVSPSLGNLNSLTFLDLSNNSLRKIPKELEMLTNLKYIDIRHNSFDSVDSLPREIIFLLARIQSQNRLNNAGEIVSLNLTSLGLRNIDKILEYIPHIINLNLGDNKISRVPASISICENLEDLCLIKNKIKSLPDSIKNLTNLKSGR
ncbi:MAG: leucine-rich repeat domain-containing protein [Promethearchaeota archaeon]